AATGRRGCGSRQSTPPPAGRSVVARPRVGQLGHPVPQLPVPAGVATEPVQVLDRPRGPCRYTDPAGAAPVPGTPEAQPPAGTGPRPLSGPGQPGLVWDDRPGGVVIVVHEPAGAEEGLLAAQRAPFHVAAQLVKGAGLTAAGGALFKVLLGHVC